LKNKKRVMRTYYGVISDALEACFSFKEGLDTDAYCIDTQIPTDESPTQVFERAIVIEGTIQKAYSDAATLSEGLMADIPRIFKIVAGKRGERITQLRELSK
jgi:hypothetical protein